MQFNLKLLLIICLILHLPAEAFSQDKAYPGDLVIKLRPGINTTSFVTKLHGMKNISGKAAPVFPHAQQKDFTRTNDTAKLIDLSRYITFTPDAGISPGNAAAVIQKMDAVVYAEPKHPQSLLYIPDDPLNESQQYYLDKIQAYEAWDIQRGDSSIIIGVTDTGLDMDHEDLAPNIAYNHNDPIDGVDNDNDGYTDNYRGWDLGDDDNSPQHVLNEHGSLVSGIAAAKTDNGLGISGPGFNCRILPVKISETINDSVILLTKGYEGIVYAAQHGASVINCAWGNHYYSEFEQDMINYAVYNHDALVIAACGNNNDMRNFYPASYDNVLSVAATTEADEKWTPENTGTNGGSSYGYHVDLSAPGTMMHTCQDGGGYRMVYAGTSFANPVVSGIAGLVRSEYPWMSALQVLERLKNTTDVIDTIAANSDFAGLLGTGRLNAHRALTDPFGPGIVFRDIELTDDRENNYENSMLVEIRGEFFNYLSRADNLQVNISCDNPDITLITENINPGALDSLQGFSVDENPILFEINEGAPANEKVILQLDMSDGSWERTQYIECLVNPAWKDLRNEDIRISISGQGILGFTDIYRTYGRGMKYENHEDIFYDAGMLMGNSSEKIIDCIRDENDFGPGITPFYTDIPGTNEAVSGSFFATDQANAVNLEIIQRAMAPSNHAHYIIVSYDIINHNLASLDNWYSGLFFDWDLIIANENHTGYDSTRNFAWAGHTGELKLYTGLKLLSSQPMHHYAIDQTQPETGIIDMSNGYSDEEKWYSLSNTTHEAGTEESGRDVAQVIGAGPYDIPPEDTVRVCFAIMAGNNMPDLYEAADSAAAFYQTSLHEANVDVLVAESPSVFPNPSTPAAGIVVVLPEHPESGKLSIYSLTGNKLWQRPLNAKQSKINPGLDPGHYLLVIESENKIHRQKLIISDVD